MNILGDREPDIYGKKTWKSIKKELEYFATNYKIKLIFYQSNHEGDIVDFIQKNSKSLNAIILNPAALTKGGYSILESLNAHSLPYVEVHMTNIVKRGDWHSKSIFSKDAIGCIFGFKSYVYELGLYALINYFEELKNESVSD